MNISAELDHLLKACLQLQMTALSLLTHGVRLGAMSYQHPEGDSQNQERTQLLGEAKRTQAEHQSVSDSTLGGMVKPDYK